MGQSPYPGLNPDADLASSGQGALEALRKLRQAAGIQPGSVIDTEAKSIKNAPGNLVQGIGQGASNMWDSLAKVPAQQPGGDVQMPSGVPSMGMGGPNMGAAQAPPSEMDRIRGGIQYSGPKLNTEGALAGLKGMSEEEQQEPYIPTEELYKHAFADPNTMQSGAPQAAQYQLRDRLGDQDFMKNLQQKAYGDVSDAETSLNPTVQAGAEAQARRASYPAQIAANAQVESSRINNEYPSAMAKMLLGQQGGQQGIGTNGIRSFSKTGMTFNPSQQVPPALLTALQKAQAQAGGMDVFGSNAQNLQRTQQDVLNAMQGISPKVKMGMMQILANPQAPVDGSQYSDDEKQQMEYIHSFLGLK